MKIIEYILLSLCAANIALVAAISVAHLIARRRRQTIVVFDDAGAVVARFAIKGDDATAAFRAALSCAADVGSDHVDVPPGAWRISGSVEIPPRKQKDEEK